MSAGCARSDSREVQAARQRRHRPRSSGQFRGIQLPGKEETGKALFKGYKWEFANLFASSTFFFKQQSSFIE